MIDNSERSVESKPSASQIQLPWSISSSVANLVINWAEGGRCIVSCDTFFGLHHAEPRYKRVAIHFKHCVGAFVQMRKDESERVGGDRYDWTGIRIPRVNSEAELNDWLREYADDWSSSGICPNSEFFQVDHSAWAESFNYEYNHYIIKGPSSYVEVLAREFQWSVEFDLSE